jgi:hypothetical protein
MRLILATNFIDKYDWCFYKRMVKWTNVVRKIHRVPAIAD